MLKYQEKIKALLDRSFGLKNVILTIPPDSKLGDIALPCFAFAKQLRKSPIEIANEIRSQLQLADFIEKIEVNGGYLNFFINRTIFIKDILTEIKDKKDSYGSSFAGKGKKALVEHTSINPNASPHVGRARNALIGDVIVRLLSFQGYEVNTHYFVNDIGKQIAMLLLGVKDKKDIAFNDLLDIYVNINKQVEENPELEKEIFSLLHKLENGDIEVKDKFRNIVDICIKGQTKILGELGIKYDTFKFESDYIWSNRVEEILQLLKDTNKLEEASDGRLILNQEEYKLPMKAPYLVLTRKDKTSLYPLRDIAYTIDKAETNSDKNIVVLGEDQKLYFQQVKAALEVLGYKSPEPVHYSFVLLSDGKMATRKGNVVLLEDFMKEALLKATKNMEKRYESFSEETSKAIAYGAVKYAFLKIANDKNVTFYWDSALSFEGDSGPYLQYSYARINSILKKHGKPLPKEADFSLLKEAIEFDLVKDLSNLRIVIDRALQEASPNIIANYVYGIAKKFSLFYHECPVINANNEELKEARLLLIDAIRQVIKICLELLGIDTVEYM
ncbi:arginine--tRNA ligase [Clostridium sp. 19966]|uniref:arginine--tRNA ligase n=1 Tax=Clostridium sp. 19966 TaxID=2768166 RepID=UPI0028DD87DB|nr:arginine--tRNA ligase [Clostridium sp. 19966]MDT8718410.1 arginine--tRNA ligase [Clostridium sp. 19966]